MKTLMHICCAPCANLPIDLLREEGREVTGFWYNPNIHPYTEYQSRKQALEGYANSIDLPLFIGGRYDLRGFITAVAQDIDGRCAHCYQCRMDQTAHYAKEHGFPCFTTSLLISPYQDYGALCRAAERAEKRYGVEFVSRDFRPIFRQGQEKARELELYMQKYCGCIFSEEERYQKRK